MPIFVRLRNQDRVKFFEEIKKNIGTWDKFFPQYNISRLMFFHYKLGRFDIPEELFLKWQKISGKSFRIKKIEKCRYVRKKVKVFNMDYKLAEIFGVLNGDGHISRKEVCVVGNINEVEYCLHLKRLFENKFGLEFKLIKDYRQNSFKLRTYSVDLSRMLRENYGLPIGNKMGKLRIPVIVLRNIDWSRCYLRGLFDTDGGFHIRRKKDPMIEITGADPRYLDEVKSLLEYLGFRVSKSTLRLYLYNKGDIMKFFKEIRPANTKHLKKYQEWYSKYAPVA